MNHLIQFILIFFLVQQNKGSFLARTESIYHTIYDIPPVNLDLAVTDILQLESDEERYLREKNNLQKANSIEEFMATSNSAGEIERNFKLIRYESSSRENFDSEKMDYILGRNPNSVVAFKDTRTILVPEYTMAPDKNSDPSKSKSEEGERFIFEEFDFGTIAKYESQRTLFPATSCLKFSCQGGEGSVSLGYNIGISISPYAKLGAGLSISSFPDNMTLALNYALQYKITKSATFSGTHSCSTKKGKSIRLFYKLGTIEVETMKRKIIYDKLERSFLVDNWQKIGTFKYLADSTPMYYCITDDQMDLRCDEPGVEYIDDDGYIIKSII